MEDMDYSYYDYQYSDWDVDTVDLHFVSGDSHSSLTHLTIILTAYGLKEPLLSWMALYIFVKKIKNASQNISGKLFGSGVFT
jgi:hypothetical protein